MDSVMSEEKVRDRPESEEAPAKYVSISTFKRLDPN
jgi:hypothetical protein